MTKYQRKTQRIPLTQEQIKAQADPLLDVGAVVLVDESGNPIDLPPPPQSFLSDESSSSPSFAEDFARFFERYGV